jgi:hypothetical protein
MSQNQEIIESKLCAYIDGELDPEGRAEIEKHLEANPQHRRLLESLKATRDLLRWLPREPAPPELAETLNGQLERSVLLDYDGESLRPRIFPRIFAAAAIIILTAGLAAAVYFALPKSHRNATQIAVNNGTEQAKQPGASGGLADATASHPGERDKEAEYLGKLGRAAKGGAQASESEDQAKLKSDSELDQVAQEVAANTDTIVAAANGTVASQTTVPPINNAVVMLVRSDKPEAAQKELADYLTSNQIQWRAAELSQQQESANNVPDRNFAMRSSREGLQAPAVQQLQQQREVSTRREEAQRVGGQYSAKSTSVDAATNPVASALAANPSPATQPSEGHASTEQRQNPAQSEAGPAPQQVAPQQGYLNAAYANNSRANNLYVARMSRNQARALSTTMSRQGTQAAEVKEVFGGGGQVMADASAQGGFGGAAPAIAATQPASRGTDALSIDARPERRDMTRRGMAQTQFRSSPAATTQPAGDVIQIGDELRLVSEDLKKAANGEPRQTVRVAPDGTVNLPSVGVFHCAGLTVEQANKSIAETSAAKPTAKDGAAGTLQGLKVERLATADAKRAMRPEANSSLAENAQSQAAVATTQSAVEAEFADEPVNVVIVVEPNAEAPANAPAPASQPEEKPATQPAPSSPQTVPVR